MQRKEIRNDDFYTLNYRTLSVEYLNIIANLNKRKKNRLFYLFNFTMYEKKKDYVNKLENKF